MSVLCPMVVVLPNGNLYPRKGVGVVEQIASRSVTRGATYPCLHSGNWQSRDGGKAESVTSFLAGKPAHTA